jgi:hypothetical protein
MTAQFTAPPDTHENAAGPFAWFGALPKPDGRRAFAAAFGGYGLDAYDFQLLPLGLTAIVAYFGISKGQAGLLSTVTLVVSAIGGAGAGYRGLGAALLYGAVGYAIAVAALFGLPETRCQELA